MNQKFKSKEFIGCIIGAILSCPFLNAVLIFQIKYPNATFPTYPTWISLDMALIGLPLLSICLYILSRPIYKSDGDGEFVKELKYQ